LCQLPVLSGDLNHRLPYTSSQQLLLSAASSNFQKAQRCAATSSTPCQSWQQDCTNCNKMAQCHTLQHAGCLQVVFTCQLVRGHNWRVATAVCFAKIQRQAIAAAGPADCCQSHMTSGVHQAHHCLGRDSTAARAGADRLLGCWRK